MKLLILLALSSISLSSMGNVRGYYICSDFKESLPEARVEVIEELKVALAEEKQEMVFGETMTEFNSEDEVKLCVELVYKSVLE